MSERRQTERIFIRIPIQVRGVDVLGKPFTEETATVVINRDGARIGLTNVPHFGSKVEITNLSNRLKALFDVTAPCPQSYTGTPEWGVEFADWTPHFWGIAFEVRKIEGGPAASALLFCKGCNRREMVNLSADDYEAFEKAFVLSRSCAQCATETTWEVAATEAETTAPAPAAATREGPEGDAGARGGAERRAAKRATIKLPVQVTGSRGASELTETENLSKSGLSFTSGLELDCGETIQVVVGYGVAETPSTHCCRVIWKRPQDKSVRYLYGVQVQETGPPPVH